MGLKQVVAAASGWYSSSSTSRWVATPPEVPSEWNRQRAAPAVRHLPDHNGKLSIAVGHFCRIHQRAPRTSPSLRLRNLTRLFIVTTRVASLLANTFGRDPTLRLTRGDWQTSIGGLLQQNIDAFGTRSLMMIVGLDIFTPCRRYCSVADKHTQKKTLTVRRRGFNHMMILTVAHSLK